MDVEVRVGVRESPVCPGSWPKETKIILGRWGRGLGEKPGRRNPRRRGGDSLTLYSGWDCFALLSPAAGARGKVGKTVELRASRARI